MMSSFLATTIKTTLCGLPFSFSRSAKMCRTGLWFEATRAAICLSEQWPIPGKSPIKFAYLHDVLPLTLSRELKYLEAKSLINRRDHHEVLPRGDSCLTPFELSFISIMNVNL